MEFLAFALKCFSSSGKLECLDKPKQILKMEMFQEILFFDAIKVPRFLKIMLLIGLHFYYWICRDNYRNNNFTLQMQEFCGVVLTVNALSRNCR